MWGEQRRLFMNSPRESHFFVLYSARHSRCGHFLERADFRVITKDDLIHWSHDMAAKGLASTLPLHCDACSEDVPPTHLRVVEDANLMPRTIVPEIEITKFKPDDWILKTK
jgi:hypothetical protein